MQARPRAKPIGAVLAAAGLLLLAGCGSSSSGDYGGTAPDYAQALAGSPAPLAAIHRQANDLLPGGEGAYDRRISGLHGFPAVVNVWASWCGPCRFEFPSLQQASARYGRKVAFLGINSDDSNDAASTFLREYPVSYPSYTDPDKAIANKLGVTFGFPGTAFYDRTGKLAFVKQGPFTSDAELRADIERYALGNAQS